MTVTWVNSLAVSQKLFVELDRLCDLDSSY